MRTILVTGCNRGIGLGLIRHLVKEKIPPLNLIATCRNLAKATELQQIASKNGNVHILDLDVRDVQRFEEFSNMVGSIVKDNGLNVLINNAGVSQKFTRIQLVKHEQLVDAFNVNTIGPIMLTKALLPLLKQAANSNPAEPMGANKALVVNVTSILGSISSNTDGGFYPYRCSKAALNMATRSLGADLRREGIIAIAIHPGWVKTEMGGPSAPLGTDESVKGILQVIKDTNESHSGGAYQYDGQILEW